jgi:hypothetical protein
MLTPPTASSCLQVTNTCKGKISQEIIMNFKDLSEIEAAGFKGFKSKRELFVDSSSIPKIKGVYLVLSIQRKPPLFVATGSGGHFKGRDPNVSVDILAETGLKM